MKRIGFLLGSFDPVHIGHIYMATEALNNDLVDEVIFVPTFQNPWKNKSTDFHKRCLMLEMAITSLENCKISMIEQSLTAPYYSYNTLKALSKQYANDDLYLIVGADVVTEIPHWNNGSWILSNYRLITVRRDGYDYKAALDIPNTLNVSSTYIRDLYRKKKQVYPLVPKELDVYIKKYKIYE